MMVNLILCSEKRQSVNLDSPPSRKALQSKNAPRLLNLPVLAILLVVSLEMRRWLPAIPQI